MSTATIATAGRTTPEVARTIRRSPAQTRTLLEELREAGIAYEVDDGVWRLTDDAERRYGPAFRALPSWVSGEPV